MRQAPAASRCRRFDVKGSVVTFYSYKGGVGRSFALANIATLLASWGFRTLMIDWDLEAPGLADFVGSSVNIPASLAEWLERGDGLVELLTDFSHCKQVPLDWRRYTREIEVSALTGLSLIKSGNTDETYSSRLNGLDWSEMYDNGLGPALETMFDELKAEFDFIFIDARTGITDFSGIITAQLPDVLLFLFTANVQSFRGARDVAMRAREARNNIAIDRSRLLLLPVPARFETQVEHRIASHWRTRFADELQPFYEGWAAKGVSIERLVQATTIPYVPFWSFGERLSVVEDPSFDASTINYSLETIAALLAHRLDQSKLLIESRDEFVSSARRLRGREPNPEYDIFLSYTHADRATSFQIAQALADRGVRVWSDDRISPDAPAADEISQALDASNNMVLLVGQNVSQWQENEVRSFLRQAASDKKARQLVLVNKPGNAPAKLPSFLRQFQMLVPDDIDRAVGGILEAIEFRAPNDDPQGALRVDVSAFGVSLEGATITAVAQNGTTVEGVSDAFGFTSLNLVPGWQYVLLAAHPGFGGQIIHQYEAKDMIGIRLGRNLFDGSVILTSSGFIPGLSGRLNPILDTHGRTYLYADNIAIDGGLNQPVMFEIDMPLVLDDATGRSFEIIVRYIRGRTALIDYRARGGQSLPT